MVRVAASRIAAPAAGESHREGRGALSKEDAELLVGEAVAEGAGAWGTLMKTLWDKATSRVAEQCTAMLQVDEEKSRPRYTSFVIIGSRFQLLY